MKRLLFLAVGIALLSSTSASAWNWKSRDFREQKYKHKSERSRILKKTSLNTTAPIPEPTAALVFGTALLVIGVSKRRRSGR